MNRRKILVSIIAICIFHSSTAMNRRTTPSKYQPPNKPTRIEMTIEERKRIAREMSDKCMQLSEIGCCVCCPVSYIFLQHFSDVV